MRVLMDHTGERWGKLVIIGKTKGKDEKRSYWLCQCDCGNTSIVYYSSLKQGLTTSCGCVRKTWTKYMGESNRLGLGESAFYYVYDYYIKSAKRRGYSFDLSIEYFKKLTQENCFYCGLEPSNLASKRKAYGDYTYNGIDRVDNNKGYTIDNCVPCCKHCNSAKLTMGYEEFINWIIRIYGHVQKNKLYEFERIRLILLSKVDNANPEATQEFESQNPATNESGGSGAGVSNQDTENT